MLGARDRLRHAGWRQISALLCALVGGGSPGCDDPSAQHEDTGTAQPSDATAPTAEADASAPPTSGSSRDAAFPADVPQSGDAASGTEAGADVETEAGTIDAGYVPDASVPNATDMPDAAGPTTGSAPVRVGAALQTQPVQGDSEDPAIWVHPQDAALSLIIATDKVAAPDGSVVVYDLSGQILQVIDGIDRPNNVDVEARFQSSGGTVSIAVLTERLGRRLRAFTIDPDERRLTDVSTQAGLEVLVGEPDDRGAPMGIGLYRRASDGEVFAIVSPKAGPNAGYLWQYRLHDDGAGIAATFVRRFGRFSGEGEIEAIVVDDELGYVYYADEDDGLHKWHADPDHPEADRELAHFGRAGYQGDREGLALYRLPNGRGYLVSTDQVEGGSRFFVYRREGSAADPHDHSEVVALFETDADSTDGMDVSSTDLGPAFPQGFMVAMNSGSKNFLVFDWAKLADAANLDLR